MVNEVKLMRPVVMSAIIKFIDLNDLLIGMLPLVIIFQAASSSRKDSSSSAKVSPNCTQGRALASIVFTFSWGCYREYRRL